LVGGAFGCGARASGIYRILHLGCLPGAILRVGALSFSLLFASATLQLVATLARAADPVGARWLSPDVLLLPQSLLPLTVHHAGGVLGALPAAALSWRTRATVVPNFAPLFSLFSPCA